ncbi:hypothetical protein [Oceanobacillus senegalensis]|uniref:hypothetical protein n=1 Tax=Oceanobacillus senegalensis TaxID=1936063 RepID=UPI000A3143D2|nr:hypothetical protein [Oceanobacillus senegalensis]
MKKHYQNHHHIYDLCKKHMHSYVLAETTDGTKFDGIVTGLDDEYVYFALPIDSTQEMGYDGYQSGMGHMHNYPQYPGMYSNMRNQDGMDGQVQDQHRQFGYGFPGYGFPGYGYPGYGYWYGRPPRRFRRLVLPLAALVALSTLPWY